MSLDDVLGKVERKPVSAAKTSAAKPVAVEPPAPSAGAPPGLSSPSGTLLPAGRKAQQPKCIPATIIPAIRALVLTEACGALNRVQLVQHVVDSFPVNNLTKTSVDAYLRSQAKRVGPHAGKRWVLLAEQPPSLLPAHTVAEGGVDGVMTSTAEELVATKDEVAVSAPPTSL